MNHRNVQYGILAAYTCISLAGLLYTLFRIRVPIIDPLAQFSYQMMAPYQGYSTHTKDILLEGLSGDGSWQWINPDPYFPYGDGERTVRIQFYSFVSQSEERRDAMYREFAEKILRKEQKEGRQFTALRLSIEQWPLSPNGYESGRMPGSTETLFSVTAEL